jgi:HEAT repeat protein
LTEWIAKLDDPDPGVRLAAAYALGEMGPDAKPAVARLIRALKEAEPALREFSAAALGRIGPDAKAAVPALIAAMEEEDGQPVPGLEGPSLPAVTKSQRERVARQAAEALTKIVPKAVSRLAQPNPQSAVFENVVVFKNANQQVRANGFVFRNLNQNQQIIWSFDTNASKRGKAKPDRPRSVSELIASLKHPSAAVRRTAATALAEAGAGARPALNPLLQALGDPDAKFAALAADALGKIGEPAIPRLIAALKDEQSQVRANAAHALSVMQAKAKPATQALIRALADESKPVRDNAARALRRIGDAALPDVIRALRDEVEQRRAK